MTTFGRVDVPALIEATRQENARTDTKAAALLAVVGIGFTGFSVAAAATTVTRLQGVPMWAAAAALACVTIAAEILLLVIRPCLPRGRANDRYFWHWAGYRDCPDRLAMELGADISDCRLLAQLSAIVRWKFRLIRWAVDVLLLSAPLVAAALAVALLPR